jgi:hypothetical protein
MVVYVVSLVTVPVSQMVCKYIDEFNIKQTCPCHEACRVNRGIAPLKLNLGIGWRKAVNFTPHFFYPGKKLTIPIEQEAGWAPKWVWAFGGGGGTSLGPTQIRTPDCSACSIVPIQENVQAVFIAIKSTSDTSASVRTFPLPPPFNIWASELS